MFKSSAFHLKSFKTVQLYPNEGTPLQSLELPALSCLIMSVCVSKWKVQNMIVCKFEQLILDGSLGAHSRIIVLKMLVAALLCARAQCEITLLCIIYKLGASIYLRHADSAYILNRHLWGYLIKDTAWLSVFLLQTTLSVTKHSVLCYLWDALQFCVGYSRKTICYILYVLKAVVLLL